MISKELFLEWKQHPVTEEFFSTLQTDRNILMQRWEDGVFVGEPDAANHSAGMAWAIKQMLDWNPVEDDENA